MKDRKREKKREREAGKS